MGHGFILQIWFSAVAKAVDVVHRLIYGFDGEVYADKVMQLMSLIRERSVQVCR